jgi:hypothetical protein
MILLIMGVFIKLINVIMEVITYIRRGLSWYTEPIKIVVAFKLVNVARDPIPLTPLDPKE